MKRKKIRHNRQIMQKPTRQYTCSRRRNKEDKKIWVVLEDGRKFYRIFTKRSDAIAYFTTLKTIYAEMLVQDLKENFFSSIVYTKLETTKRGLINSFEEYDGGIVEDSDQLFDEELYLNGEKMEEDVTENVSKNKLLVESDEENDFSFVDSLFPKPKPLISPYNVTIDKSKGMSSVNKKVVTNDLGIKIYQSDIELNLYVLDGRKEE